MNKFKTFFQGWKHKYYQVFLASKIIKPWIYKDKGWSAGRPNIFASTNGG